MARSRLTDTTDDLIADSGAILWSFVKGEQLEYPITLNFLENAAAGYTYEAVVIEAQNEIDQTNRPSTVKVNGVQDKLVVRIPVMRGTWQASQAYNIEDVVYYDGKYYKLLSGAAYINTATPDTDPKWQETTANIIYVQFPASLGANYTQKPTVSSSVYGFFELRVTEPANPIFVRTWKPVRGMVELQFSPTDVVPD